MYLDALLEESRIKGNEEGFTGLSSFLIPFDSTYQLLRTHSWLIERERVEEKLG